MDGQFLQLLLLPVLRTCLTVALSPALELILGRVCVCVCVCVEQGCKCLHAQTLCCFDVQAARLLNVWRGQRRTVLMCVCVCALP